MKVLAAVKNGILSHSICCLYVASKGIWTIECLTVCTVYFFCTKLNIPLFELQTQELYNNYNIAVSYTL